MAKKDIVNQSKIISTALVSGLLQQESFLVGEQANALNMEEINLSVFADPEKELNYHVFLRVASLMDSELRSKNPLNINDFTGVEILAAGECCYDLFYYNGLAPVRDAIGENKTLVKKYITSINVLGFLKADPIILDADHAVLDGYQRLLACKRLDVEFAYIRIDFNSSVTATK